MILHMKMSTDSNLPMNVIQRGGSITLVRPRAGSSRGLTKLHQCGFVVCESSEHLYKEYCIAETLDKASHFTRTGRVDKVPMGLFCIL